VQSYLKHICHIEYQSFTYWSILLFYPLANEVAKGYSNATVRPSSFRDIRKAWRIPSPNNLILWPWPLTLKIGRIPDSLKDYVCTKCGQNPLNDVDFLQRILTKLGTYLVLKRIWNSVDFQGHRLTVKVTGSNFQPINLRNVVERVWFDWCDFIGMQITVK
jgi:hypothetical protein